jgi:hypothetical protein
MVLMQGPKGNWQEFTTMPVKDIKANVAFIVELNRELAASGALRRVMSAPPVEL